MEALSVEHDSINMANVFCSTGREDLAQRLICNLEQDGYVRVCDEYMHSKTFGILRKTTMMKEIK